jgi:hypothetical protein
MKYEKFRGKLENLMKQISLINTNVVDDRFMWSYAELERDKVWNNREGDQAITETQVAESLHPEGEHLSEWEVKRAWK